VKSVEVLIGADDVARDLEWQRAEPQWRGKRAARCDRAERAEIENRSGAGGGSEGLLIPQRTSVGRRVDASDSGDTTAQGKNNNSEASKQARSWDERREESLNITWDPPTT
jgi:hypothetical protein